MPIELHGHENFAIVVAVQLLWFGLIALARGALSAAPRHLALGALAGLPIGVVFDLAIGSGGRIFHYAGLELGGQFLLLNSILSYGAAIATVLAMRVNDMPRQGRHRWLFALGAACLGFLFVATLVLNERSAIAAMLLIGASVVFFSESLALALGRKGYLLQLAEGRAISALEIWGFSVATGAVYETANYFFPLWVWTNRSPTAAGNILLIVAFGYFVLFVPIFTVTALLRIYFRRSSPAAKVI